MQAFSIKRSIIVLGCLFFAWESQAKILPLATHHEVKVTTNLDTVLLKTWGGIKKRLLEPYKTGLIHRPKSESPHDAVSEGVAYGMLCALYSNDQPTFNRIFEGGNSKMWNGSLYNWRRDINGNKQGNDWDNAATDADQDIALALIFADALVNAKIWQAYQGNKYRDHAQVMLNTIFSSMIENGLHVKPGNSWGGSNHLNPGYFAPAYYKVFKGFDKNNPNRWQGVIDQNYKTIAASPGYSKGMVPDWTTSWGAYTGGGGYNGYAEGRTLYKDAIRILWRVGQDYIWNKDPRAKTFMENALAFIKTPDRANFYKMDGSLVEGDYKLKGYTIDRKRAEHSHLTLGMWAIPAAAVGTPVQAEDFVARLLTFYEGKDYWGKSSDPGQEDTLHAEMYFDQFLAWFGAALVSGNFSNIIEDIKTPIDVSSINSPASRQPTLRINKNTLILDASKTLQIRFFNSAGSLAYTQLYTQGGTYTLPLKPGLYIAQATVPADKSIPAWNFKFTLAH